MRAWLLNKPQPVTESPLQQVGLPTPELGEHDLLIRVRAEAQKERNLRSGVLENTQS